MNTAIRFTGFGHCLGEQIISNRDLAVRMGLEPSWFESRTGISHRRECAPGQTIVAMAAQSVRNACTDAGIAVSDLGHETVLFHIQNGFTHLTPPSGILLCAELGIPHIRVISIDGACSEPINALEIAVHMLGSGSCTRAIISAAANFLPMIDPQDLATVGLFGAGAGALVLERALPGEPHGEVRSLYWESWPSFWELGTMPILDHRQVEGGVEIQAGYYAMRGKDLARTALKLLPDVFQRVLQDAGWTLTDLDRVIAHQPNVKLLEMGIARFGVARDLVETPVVELGNMGPATILVGFSLAKERGSVGPGSRILFLSFGLGFSCGAAAVVL